MSALRSRGGPGSRPGRHRSLCEQRQRRSNLIYSCSMDCFAEPVIGRAFAPTRWLAMTNVNDPTALFEIQIGVHPPLSLRKQGPITTAGGDQAKVVNSIPQHERRRTAMQ